MGVGVAASVSKKATSPTDEELMMRYISGDYRAFEALYRRHRKPIFNFILRYVKNTERAEELLQEVFMRMVQSSKKYTKQAKFTTWLYTIARNLCIDTYRRKKHRHTISLQQSVAGDGDDGLRLEQVLEGIVTEGDGERRVFSSEIRVALEKGIADLPDEQREVFLLREASQLPYKEIANIVGTLENTVKSRMRYALEYLRRHLQSAGFSLEDLKD